MVLPQSSRSSGAMSGEASVASLSDQRVTIPLPCAPPRPLDRRVNGQRARSSTKALGSGFRRVLNLIGCLFAGSFGRLTGRLGALLSLIEELGVGPRHLLRHRPHDLSQLLSPRRANLVCRLMPEKN